MNVPMTDRRLLPTLPLGALRAFDAAARHGSFKAAALELSVTPAAVSHQIKGLEKRLGTTLFDRLNRGLRLTSAGQRLAMASLFFCDQQLRLNHSCSGAPASYGG